MKGTFCFLLVTFCFILVSFIGCSGVKAREVTDEKAIKETFAQLCQKIVEGDLKAAYDIFSTGCKRRQSYEGFVKVYETYRQKLIDRYKGAFLKKVAVDGTMASAIVVWGTGEQKVLEFIKEGKAWKLEREGEKVISALP